MPVCDTCGNDYDKAFNLTTYEGTAYTFDSFECAIHLAAPRCQHCGCTVVGHGVEADTRIFCCAHCAEEAGVTALADRA